MKGRRKREGSLDVISTIGFSSDSGTPLSGQTHAHATEKDKQREREREREPIAGKQTTERDKHRLGKKPRAAITECAVR